MKKLLLIILINFISTNAIAEWEFISASEGDNPAILFTDMETIKRNGNKVKVWELIDFLKPEYVEGKPYLSAMNKSLYDCDNETYVFLATSMYEKSHGKGEVIKVFNWTSENNKERVIAPGSMNYIQMKKVCGK